MCCAADGGLDGVGRAAPGLPGTPDPRGALPAAAGHPELHHRQHRLQRDGAGRLHRRTALAAAPVWTGHRGGGPERGLCAICPAPGRGRAGPQLCRRRRGRAKPGGRDLARVPGGDLSANPPGARPLRPHQPAVRHQRLRCGGSAGCAGADLAAVWRGQGAAARRGHPAGGRGAGRDGAAVCAGEAAPRCPHQPHRRQPPSARASASGSGRNGPDLGASWADHRTGGRAAGGDHDRLDPLRTRPWRCPHHSLDPHPRHRRGVRPRRPHRRHTRRRSGLDRGPRPTRHRPPRRAGHPAHQRPARCAAGAGTGHDHPAAVAHHVGGSGAVCGDHRQRTAAVYRLHRALSR